MKSKIEQGIAYLYLAVLLIAPALGLYFYSKELLICDTASKFSKVESIVLFSLSLITSVLIYPIFIYVAYIEVEDFFKKLKNRFNV